MSVFICQFCGDNRKSNPSLINHERLCKQNPNRQIANTSAARKASSIKVFCKFCKGEFRKSHLSKHERSCIKNKNNQAQCLECYGIIRKSQKFCNSSCSASYNNKKRGIHSQETKTKISKSLSGRTHNHGNGDNHKTKVYCKIQFKKCSVCSNVFIIKNNYKDVRKTCSDECKIIASIKIRPYQNGSRKTTWYFNKNEDKEVLLESSWEVRVAKKLDELNIKWVRPNHIKWIDRNSKTRYYFPDFYLSDYDLYLDPKNPYCMEKDKEKMEKIKEKINIIYGDIDYIIGYIDSGCRP